MNEHIADILAQHFISLPAVSRAAGCVRTLKKQVQNAVKEFPAAPLVYTAAVPGQIVCEKTEDYYEITPNSSERCIIFFEDLGATNQKQDKVKAFWKGKLRLVCWSNTKLLGEQSEVGLLQRSIIAAVPASLAPASFFFGGSFQTTEIEPNRPSPFDKYDLQEEKTQFLMNPYEHFSLKIEYVAITAVNCPVNIVVNPEIC